MAHISRENIPIKIVKFFSDYFLLLHDDMRQQPTDWRYKHIQVKVSLHNRFGGAFLFCVFAFFKLALNSKNALENEIGVRGILESKTNLNTSKTRCKNVLPNRTCKLTFPVMKTENDKGALRFCDFAILRFCDLEQKN